MSTLVKWEYREDAYKYFLGIHGDDAFDEELDLLSFLDTSGDIAYDYYIKKIQDRMEDDLSDIPSIISVHEIEEDDYCRVYGSVVAPNGRPIGNAIVEAFIHDEDEPQFDDNNVYERPEEYTFTTDPGKFQVYLRRGERFIIRIPKSGYKMWFMVPDQDEAELKDIEGTSLVIRNPY